MAKVWAKGFYKSKAWLDCREGYIKVVHGLCERCGNPGDILHHKILLNPSNINNPEITLNWEHLEYLCQTCHNREHHSEEHETTRNDVKFDELGNIISIK